MATATATTEPTGTHDVECNACGWKGRQDTDPEYAERVEGPGWQPGDIFHAFSGPCPACGESRLLFDLGPTMVALGFAEWR